MHSVAGGRSWLLALFLTAAVACALAQVDVPQFTVVTPRSLWAWSYARPGQVSVFDDLPFLALNQTVRGVAHYRGSWDEPGNGTVVISNSTVAVALQGPGKQQLSFHITGDFGPDHLELLAVSFVPATYPSLHTQRVVIVALNRTTPGSEEGVVTFVRSEDGGLTWERPTVASGDLGMDNRSHQASIGFQHRAFVGLIGVATVDSRAYRSSDGGLSWVVCELVLPGVGQVIADPSYVSMEDPSRMMLVGFTSMHRTPFIYHLGPGDNATCNWESYNGQTPPPINRTAFFTGFADRTESSSAGEWVIATSDGYVWASYSAGAQWTERGIPYFWTPGDYAALVAGPEWYTVMKVSWGNATRQPTAFLVGSTRLVTYNWTVNVPSWKGDRTIVGMVAGFPQPLRPSASPWATPSSTPSSSPSATAVPTPSVSPSPSSAPHDQGTDDEAEYRMLGIGLAGGLAGGLVVGVCASAIVFFCRKRRLPSDEHLYHAINNS